MHFRAPGVGNANGRIKPARVEDVLLRAGGPCSFGAFGVGGRADPAGGFGDRTRVGVLGLYRASEGVGGADGEVEGSEHGLDRAGFG